MPAPAASSTSIPLLHVYGTRSAAQHENASAAKLDAALADLSRHLSLARPTSMLADLHALSPAARFKQSPTTGAPLVLIDAVTRTDPQQLKAQLLSLGLEHAALYANDVGGWLPVTQIEAATQLSSLVAARAAMPHARTGAVESQGDFAQGSAQLRTSQPTLTGAGITVGVLSDSYNCYAVYGEPGSGVPASGYDGYAQNGFTTTAMQDQATGDLPASVDVLEEADCLDYTSPGPLQELPFGDEGRAMLQTVYDVAPGSSLAFYTADNSEADFATGIGKLAAAGAQVEADDVGYFDEPFFQDGILAQAIDNVEAQGVAYFSAAGNDSNLSYENTTPVFGTLSNSAPNSGEYLLNFDASTTALPVSIPSLAPGEFVAVVLEWDQPYVTGAPDSGGATSALDLCITGASGSDVIIDLDGNSASCTGPNSAGVDPVQVLIIGNSAANPANSAATTINLMVGLANGTSAPGRIKIAVEDDGAGATINAFQTNSGTLQGHPGAAGAMAIGAAFFADTPLCGISPALPEPYSSWGGTPILFDSAGNRLSAQDIQTRQKPDVVGPDGGNTTFFGWPLADFGLTDNSSVAECKDNPSYPHFFGTSAATPHVAGLAALLLQADSSLTPTQLYDAIRTTAAAMGTSTPNYQSGYGFVQAQAAYAALPAHTTPSQSKTSSSSSTSSGGGGGGALDLSSLLLLAAIAARRVRRRLSCG